MKHLLTTALSLATLLGLAAQPLQAQELKVGAVDLTRVITEYYKFKEARNELQDDAAKAQKEVNESLAYGQKLRDAFSKLQKEAQDPILNEKDKKAKLDELREKQQEALQWDRDFQDLRQKRQKALTDRQGRMFNGIREEVLTVVQEVAESEGYTIVLEKSAMGASPKIPGLALPILIHSKGETDFSDDVIVELNKDAPAEEEAAAPSE